METATQPTPIEIECQFCEFKGSAAEGASHRQETQHLIRIVGERDTPAPQETPAQQGAAEQLADALGMRINGSRWHKVIDVESLSFDNPEQALCAIRRDPAFQKLVSAVEKFVNAYQGNKAAWLGNGQARRSLDEFREALRLAREGE